MKSQTKISKIVSIFLLLLKLCILDVETAEAGPFKSFNVCQKIENDYMRVFATKNPDGKGDCMFYIFTNKEGKLKIPTPLEI